MSMNRTSWSLLYGAFVGMVACDSTARDPIAPNFQIAPADTDALGTSVYDDDSGDDPVSPIASLVSVTGGSASGHAFIHATSRQNVVYQSYSFAAASTGVFPRAHGRFDAHGLRFTGENVDVGADVTCMAIVGDQAWIGAHITRATVDGVEVPNSVGLPLTFRVQAHSAGVNATDFASLFFLPAIADGDVTFCNTRPTTNALRVSSHTNIRVTPAPD